MNAPTLFTPLTLGPLTLPNRIIMAPLTRLRAAMPGNIPHGLNAEYYRQRSTAGLIVSEATPVCPTGHGYFHTPGIHTPEQAEGWRLVTQAVHAAGGRIFLQLWHVGRQSHPDLQPGGALPVAPSAIVSGSQSPIALGVLKDHPVPRALDEAEIPGLVADYAAAARRALEAGFDGVEIHAANGYLIEQFLSDGANVRTDHYGGTIENRNRFLLEVTAAVIGVWGADRVGVRLSPANTFGGIEHRDRTAQFQAAIVGLARWPLAYLHLVEPRVAGNTDLREFDESLFSHRFRAFLHPQTRLLSAGGHDRETGEMAVAEGRADAVAYGRAFLANPDLPRRFSEGAALNAYDRSTFYGGTSKGYTDHPFLDPKEAA